MRNKAATKKEMEQIKMTKYLDILNFILIPTFHLKQYADNIFCNKEYLLNNAIEATKLKWS